MAEKAEEEEVGAKKSKKGISAYYNINEKKLERLLPFCERCGPGYFMANHGDRYTCGHCGFTRYKRAETSE
jgi:small subunit ribosomal protein S27Ae